MKTLKMLLTNRWWWWGGGILRISIFAILLLTLSNLNAIELTQICTSTTEKCKISTEHNTITNHISFTAPQDEGVYIEARIGTFANYGNIIEASGNQTFKFESTGYIEHFINYGNISKNSNMSFWGSGKGISNLTNYGKMGAIEYSGSETMTLNNFGVITQRQGSNLKATNGNIFIQNYVLIITKNADTFNKNININSQSHIVVSGSVNFKDETSKIILDFGDGFEFGVEYKTTNIASGLNVDYSRLRLKNDIYTLYKQGDYFVAKLTTQYGIIGTLHKANIRTMNNFYLMSNSMIYPRKHNFVILIEQSDRRISKNILSLRDLPTANRGNPKDLRAKRSNHPPYENITNSALDSANSLKSYESFAYQNESQNLQTRRIKRANKRNYSRNLKDSSLRVDSQNLNKSAESKPYYFILTPFVNHNLFFESGRYNLSGFDYGFLTAFSARVAESNSLGAHFMMSYGSLDDSSDKNFHISNLNLNLGVNYKLDLIWDMYVKARGDFFYFLNQVKTLTMIEAIKPNNLGFGVSVSYGKDFDFKQGGVLGIEVGLDYKALNANKITLNSMSETYQKSLYHLLYLDLGISYAKYFGNFGINANLGIKGNITANQLAKSQIRLNNFNRSVDMILDNDKILGYANVALSYVLNHRNFDMEFSLAYYGNFGDRIISNGGGVEWRVFF